MAKQITNHEQNLRIIDQVTITGTNLGVGQLSTEDAILDGRTIKIRGREIINFSSCSYLGLEMNESIKNGAIEAIKKFGTQFSSSRAYLSLSLYRELENLLSLMFEMPVIASPTTTLGHFSNIPVLVSPDDLVIMDAKLHASVQMALQLIKARGGKIEVVRHNRIDMLEDIILDNKDKYQKIWYMADGVYSMYGDYSPVDDLMELLDRHEQLHLYFDDAHGMSWSGKNGTGYVRSKMKRHERLYLTTSLNKAFAAGGGALIFPNEEARRRVRNCGSTMIFSGPMQPSSLGAGIASAEIHLSNEIYGLQEQLQNRITYFHDLAKKLNLPLISDSNSPIKFIGVGKPGVGYSMVRRLMDKGYFINLSVFPSVSYNNTGLRIPITNHHTLEDIESLLNHVARELPLALLEEQSSIKQIYQAFRLVG